MQVVQNLIDFTCSVFCKFITMRHYVFLPIYCRGQMGAGRAPCEKIQMDDSPQTCWVTEMKVFLVAEPPQNRL